MILPVGIGYTKVVFQTEETRIPRQITDHVKSFILQTVVEFIIFTAPTPELVAETIGGFVLAPPNR